MPLDLDLQELRRAVAAESTSAAAWLALAHGLARAGARGDSIESYYRARALGAEARPCREGLAALGARPSPWTHVAGDSEHSWSAPVRGPRRGEVVAREAVAREIGSREERPAVVVDEDARLVVGTRNAIAWHVSRTLAPIAGTGFELAGSLAIPAVTSAGVVVLASGRGLTRLFCEGAPPHATELPGLPWEGASPAALGSRTWLACFRVPGATFEVESFDESLKRVSGFELKCHRWGAWALSERGLALVADEEIRWFALDPLDGIARYRRPCARSIDGLALVGERVVWSELRQSDANTSTRWVQMLDPKGDYVWARNLEHHEAPGRLALSPEGTVHVASRDGLVRFTSDGRRVAGGPRTLAGSEMVVDREGVAYVQVENEGTPGVKQLGLAAIAPDGARLFFVPEALCPVALDGLGRLLALTSENLLVAIE